MTRLKPALTRRGRFPDYTTITNYRGFRGRRSGMSGMSGRSRWSWGIKISNHSSSSAGVFRAGWRGCRDAGRLD